MKRLRNNELWPLRGDGDVNRNRQHRQRLDDSRRECHSTVLVQIVIASRRRELGTSQNDLRKDALEVGEL